MISKSPSPLHPPVYSTLKDLHLTTELVRDARPAVTIVIPQDGSYDSQADQLQKSIETISGVKVPVATDLSEQGRIPFQTNLILLGNRSTNATISTLYDLFYTLLDLRYPGPDGYVVRSLHNPFGDGRNVIFLGGSDTQGVSAATDSFCRILSKLPKNPDRLSVGWLAQIRLGKGQNLPQDIREVKTWEDSPLYQSKGYFVWNSISKHMAMYYMTGEERHAREVLRLSFPDETAKQQIAEIDDELIENKDDPLSGPYHYAALMLILFWDLIEESPVFSDADRLRITNAFSRQLAHPQELGWREEVYNQYGQEATGFANPPKGLGHRHGSWSYLSLYALCRYFQNYYPHPLWRHCLDGVHWFFSSLQQHCRVEGLWGMIGEWYSSCISPVLSYMILTGNRITLEKGTRELLLGQEIIISGQMADHQSETNGRWSGDLGLGSASMDYLHKAACLTKDGRFLEYLRRTEMDLDNFRIGQSFWPKPGLQHRQPDELAGRWTMLPMPEPQWRERASGVKLRESFLTGSFRSSTDDAGDYLLFKTFREDEHYHTFEIHSLRIKGRWILDRGNNHLFVRIDGMAPPEVSQDSAIRAAHAMGNHALIQAQVANAGYARWQRTLLLHDSRFTLIVDRVTFTNSSENGEMMILWQGPGQWSALTGEGAIQTKHQDSICDIRSCDDLEITVSDNNWGLSRGKMVWRGAANKGESITFFTLIAESDETAEMSCRRLNDQTALLKIPTPALVTADGYEGVVGELVLLTENDLHGQALRKIETDTLLLKADLPLHCNWNFKNGVLEVDAQNDTQISCNLIGFNDLMIDGSPVRNARKENGLTLLQVPAGKHVIQGAIPTPQAMKSLGQYLNKQRQVVPEQPKHPQAVPVAKLKPLATAKGAGPVVAMVTAPEIEGGRIYAAAGEQVHVWTPSSGQSQSLPTDSTVQVLHHWAEHKLILAGCKNGEVIAFDLKTGRRRWTFMSKIDPAVIRAGKPYWFRTSAGHEGIHGLHTGVFYQGKSQAFIGSTCTLEIIDEQGQLLRRLPIFWGPCHVFSLMEASDKSINLLIARRPTDTHAVVVVNNRHEYVPNMLGPDPFSFHDVPPGHTDISAWGQMTRNAILHDDIDADDHKEVISDTDGAWNRITVWSDDARPLYNANFGPGPFVRLEKQKTTMQGLALAELDGSGQKAILTASADGWVVALNHQCQKIWSQHLAAVPVTLKTLNTGAETRIIIACENGAIYVLNRQGDTVATAQVSGKPVCMETCRQKMVVATENGGLEIVPID